MSTPCQRKAEPALHTNGVKCRFLSLLLSLIDADRCQRVPASMSDNERNKRCTQFERKAGFIVIFATLSFAMLKCERAIKVWVGIGVGGNTFSVKPIFEQYCSRSQNVR